MAEYWYDVLSHFENKGYYNNGLSIPFLIGSRTILEPSEPLDTIEDFIMDISTSEYPITLMRCGWLKEYVLGILDSYTNDMRSTYKNMYKEFGNLIIIDDSFAKLTTLEEIISELENDLSGTIKSGGYSKIAGEWTEFDSETDLVRLNEIIVT